MSQPLFYARSIQGYPSTSCPFSDNKYKALLEDGVALSFIAPSSDKTWIMQVVVQPQTIVWCSLNQSPDPSLTASTLESSNCDLINSYEVYQRNIVANDEVFFVSEGSGSIISISLYSLI